MPFIIGAVVIPFDPTYAYTPSQVTVAVPDFDARTEFEIYPQPGVDPGGVAGRA